MVHFVDKPRSLNLYAGPGVGKTTLATAIFSELKFRNLNIEFVSEYAKEIAWQDNPDWDQDKIFLTQSTRMKIASKVDFVITDGPLLQNLVYTYDAKIIEAYLHEYSKYDNFNIFINRGPGAYNSSGRYQTSSEALEVDEDIYNMLSNTVVQFEQVDFKRDSVNRIINMLTDKGWINNV